MTHTLADFITETFECWIHLTPGWLCQVVAGADHDLYYDLSQSPAGQVRDRLGSRETEVLGSALSDQ